VHIKHKQMQVSFASFTRKNRYDSVNTANGAVRMITL